jgi:hypothetical protein
VVLDLVPNQDYTIHQAADKKMNLFTIIVELAEESIDKQGAKAE